MAQLLITGGAGFIGSHACLSFLEAGHSLVVLDNYSNSSVESLKRVTKLAFLNNDTHRLQLIEGDICNIFDLDVAFKKVEVPIDAVVHFAGLKAVGESIQDPIRYWNTNVYGTLCLLEAMKRHGCYTIVFSSSATVYGHPESIPIKETAQINPINPYGKTKAAVENILFDLAASDSLWRVASLRYFNPVGAHPSGSIGEDPTGLPNNLFPFVSQVGIGRRDQLQIFGADWPTPDGSAIRDFIHVMDLVEGHRAALDVLLAEAPQAFSLNLGTGKGYSVFEVIECFEKVLGKKLSCKIASRRAGDIPFSVADSSLANKRLGWVTNRTLMEMCKDSLAWQNANPFGYKSN